MYTKVINIAYISIQGKITLQGYYIGNCFVQAASIL